VEGEAFAGEAGAFEERFVLPVVEVVVVGRATDAVGEDEIGVAPGPECGGGERRRSSFRRVL
jgi:hypothetical protein